MRGEVFYVLAFYNGKVAKSKSIYFVKTQLDTSSRFSYTVRNSAGAKGGNRGGATIDFSYQLDDDMNVHLNWTITNGMPVETFEIERNNEMLANLQPNELTYTDINPGLGSYIYTLSVRYTNGTMDVVDV